MALLSSSRVLRIPQHLPRTIFTSPNVDGPGTLPENPYWEDPEKKIIVKPFEEIPGPKPVFFLGNTWRYWPIVGEYSFLKLNETYLKMHQQYGHIVREKVHPTRTIVHLFHPEDIMAVFKAPWKYPLRKSHTIMEKYRRDRPHIYTSIGLGSSNGEEWRTFRALFSRAGGQRLIYQFKDRIDDLSNELVEKISLGLDSKNEMDVRTPLFRWAFESIGVVTLCQRLGCMEPEKNAEADKLIKAVHTTHDAIYMSENHMSPLVQWREYRRLSRAQDYFAGIIRTRLLQSIGDSHGGNINMLNLINNENSEATIQDVCTLILDLFQGGIHTVSYTLSFAMLHLGANKDLQDELRKALVETMPTKTSKVVAGPTWAMLHRYIDETLRMNPPTIGTGRILNQDMVLGGYNVPAGTIVILHNQVASMQEEFFKNPHVYDPSRFQQKKDRGISDPVGKFAFLPFSHGIRGCIASGLARMEMCLALGKIVRNFEISYHHERVSTVNKLHNEPDKPVLLHFKKIDY